MEEDSLSRFYENIDDVQDLSLQNNPDVLLNEIALHMDVIVRGEPNASNIEWMTRILNRDKNSVFLTRSDMKSTAARDVFDQIDTKSTGVMTVKDLRVFGTNTKSRKEFLDTMALLLDCDKGWVALSMYASEQLRRNNTRDDISEDTRRMLVIGDYWLALRENGDELACDVDIARQKLMHLVRSVKLCYERNADHRSHGAMNTMLNEEPLTRTIASRYVQMVEPLMMAIYRNEFVKSGNAAASSESKSYAESRDETFEWLETMYNIKRSSAIDAFNPELKVVEESIRLPQSGDRILVTKDGSQYGNMGTVTDPHWYGRVKVRMDSGAVKSYLFSKGEIEVVLEAGAVQKHQ